MAGILIGTSPILGYGSPKHTTALSVNLLSASFQASVRDTLPEEHSRRLEQLPAAFMERLPVASSREVKRPSVPRQLFAPMATVIAQTATTTTITTHMPMASAVVVAEAAANELLPIGGPRSTVVSPTSYARSGYFPYPSRAISRPGRGAVERPTEVSLEAWAGRNGERTDSRNRGYGAERGMHFEQTVPNYGFNAGMMETEQTELSVSLGPR